MASDYDFQGLRATSSTVQRHLMDKVLCEHAGEGPMSKADLVESAEALHESLGGFRIERDVRDVYKSVLSELVNSGRLMRPGGAVSNPVEANQLTSSDKAKLRYRLFWQQNANCARCGERMRAGASVHLAASSPGPREAATPSRTANSFARTAI